MSHNHSHAHAHRHGAKNYNRAFALGIFLNLSFVFIEAIYGFLSNSLALIADAGHNLSDVAGLLIAWGAFYLMNKKPSEKYTYGLKRTSILSALLNAVLLLVAVGGICFESFRRLFEPSVNVQSTTVIVVAGIGVLINGATALLFLKDQHHDLNIKGAYLHMVADALISVGVAVSGVLISYTGLMILDPIVSIAVCLIIISGTWGLLKDSVLLSLDAVPEAIEIKSVQAYLEGVTNVVAVHDLHIWAMSTTETALSAHLLISPQSEGYNALLSSIKKDLLEKFKIHHPTIQIEQAGESMDCSPCCT